MKPKAEHDRDWHESEDRNDGGYPQMSGPRTRPRAQLEMHPGAGIAGPVNFDQRSDQSQNKALPWVIATGVCALSIGLALGVALMSHGQITSEGRAVRAEVAMDFQKQIADFDARLRVTEYEASLAKTIAQRLDGKANDQNKK